nr:hypothetical protein [Tanacetum cinerariifolium]
MMALCTNLQNRVLDLEQTKTTQKKEIASHQNEIASLKMRVKKLEKRNRSRTHRMKRLYKERRINAIDADEDITLVSAADNEMFDVDVLGGEKVFVAGQNKNVVEEVVDAAQISIDARTITITTEEIILAQALEALKTSKAKAKGIFFQEPGKSTTTTTISSQQSHDNEERLAREKAEKEERANIALIEEWDDIQANIDADHQLAERLQAQEQKELFDAENATLFQQLLEKRRKHFERIIGIKSLIDAVEITVAQVYVNTALMKYRSTETFDELASTLAQLNNLGREIKKVNKKVYATQVGCEQCKGPHYTKDFTLKEEWNTPKEAYYTQFGAPFQGGGYKATASGFYQRKNASPRTKNEDNLWKKP